MVSVPERPQVVSAATLGAGVLTGGTLMLAGVVLESVANARKQAAKAVNPGTLTTAGLFARLRYPNYLGEIVFQLGLIVATIAGAPGGWALAAGSAGPLYIVILMYYAADDQDRQQAERYGQDATYQAWRRQSSSLVPGL